MKIGFLKLIMLLSFSRSLAMVDMRDLSYSTSAMDIDLSSLHDSLRVQRLYDSRSRHNGAFGFGWCAEFENRLSLLNDGGLSLFECGLPDEPVFRKRSTDGRVFISDNPALGEIEVLSSGFFHRRLPTGRREVFSSDGRLKKIYDPQERELEINRDSNQRPITLSTRSGGQISLQWDKQRVARASGPRQLIVDYRYSEYDLVDIEVGTGRRTRYLYDRLHNLREVRFDGVIREQIDFDTENDRVLSRTETAKARCRETFALWQEAGKVESVAQKRCLGTPSKITKFGFWYGSDSGRVALLRMRVQRDAESTDVLFDAESGQPYFASRKERK